MDLIDRETRVVDLGLRRRFVAVANKVGLLSSLRSVVSLGSDCDIAESQWAVIETQLFSAEAKLRRRLKADGREHLRLIHRPGSRKALNVLLGSIELELSKSLFFFDTFMDILSQRHLPGIGLLLGGCDALALDALRKDHPALSIIERPLVSFNKGFGASILREGVPMPDGTLNPLPTIQIPYTKLKEKCNLTSVIHEAGHSAMVRLGLVFTLPETIEEALADAGAPKKIRELFALWSKEIGPDFWGFCNSGTAQASSVKEILGLPPKQVFKVSSFDPHPPPFLRVLMAFEWCRQQWGRGAWDEWEKQWLELYPLDEAPARDRKVLAAGKRHLPDVARALLGTRFAVLNNRTIPMLFDLDEIAPRKLARIVRTAESRGFLDFMGISPCGQLAAFRALRDQGKISEAALDRLMTSWLIRLGKGRHTTGGSHDVQ